MKFKADPVYKPSNFQLDIWQVEKLVELPAPEFDALVTIPMEAHPVIAENKQYMFSDGGMIHSLLVLGEGRRDGVLVESEGYDCVRYGAYVNGARDIVNAELERAADFILRECIENRGAESWQAHFNDRPACGSCRVSFQELEKKLGLTIREGNGLDTILLDALRRRPEVSAVALSDGCIETDYDLSPRENTDIGQKKLSPPLTNSRKADLFDNAVSAICELFQGEDLYTMLNGSFGLTLPEIREHKYMSDQEIAEACCVPEKLLDCDMTVRDVLKLEGVSKSAALTCKGFYHFVPLKALEQVTADGQDGFDTLLDARVVDIKADDGPELVLEGVEAAELERIYDALEDQGQAMGPTMG